MAYWHWGSGLDLPCSLVKEVAKVVFEKCEEVNVAVMVVDQNPLQQVVLKKMKVGWCLLETVVIDGQGRHLKVALVL